MKAAAALHQSRFKPMLLDDFAKLLELLKEARAALESCHSERLQGAKNLGLLPKITFENEILRRSAPQNDISW